MSLKQHRDALCSVLPVAAIGVTRPRRKRKPKPRQTEEFCRDNGEIYEVGAEWSDPGICNLKTCRAGGLVEIKRCPHPEIPDGCTLGEPDLGQTFPYCCPKAECSSRNRRDSSSSSSSSSSSDDPDKYEDLDDDDCGDDGGGDMTMDFTMMGVDQEESQDKNTGIKTTGHNATNTVDLVKLKQLNENVKPPDIKSTGYQANKNCQNGKCSERREIRENFHSIKEGSMSRNLTSFDSVKQSEPKENLKMFVSDKETVEVAVEVIKDKNVVIKTDVCPIERISIHRNTEVNVTANNTDLMKVNLHNEDVKLSDKTRMENGTETSYQLGQGSENSEIKDFNPAREIIIPEIAIKIVSVKQTEQKENPTILAKDQDSPLMVVEVVKVEKNVEIKTDTDPAEKTFHGKIVRETPHSNPVQEIEKYLDVKHSHVTEAMHVSEGIEVKAQEFKITEMKANSQSAEGEICKDKTFDKSDEVGEKNSMKSFEENSKGMKEAETTLMDTTHKHNLESVEGGGQKPLSFVEDSHTDIKNSAIKVTEVTVKSTSESTYDNLESNTEYKPNVSVDETINVLKLDNNLLTDIAHEYTPKKTETSEQFSDNNNKIIANEKTHTDIQENENPTTANHHARDWEGADKVLVLSDKSNSFMESNGPTDKVTECSEATFEVSSEKYSSESLKEPKMDTDRFEDEGARLKEVIDSYYSAKGTIDEILNNEGKLDCWEGMEKMPPVSTQEEQERLYQELGPDKEFEKAVEKLEETRQFAKIIQENSETNCSEGLTEYYKHVDLHKENEKFQLEPAEDIGPIIKGLEDVSKFAKNLENQQEINSFSFDEEFTKYNATVDNEIHENPFARFEIHPDHEKSQGLREEQNEDVNKEVEELQNDAVNTENDQNRYSLEVNTDTIQPQHTEEVGHIEEHSEVVENDAHTETIPECTENTTATSDFNEEHFHTTVDISGDILGYNQALESETTTGETEFNVTALEDVLTHSVDESQESNPLGMISDGPMSSSADIDRFAPSSEAGEEEDESHDHDQLTTNVPT